MTPDPTNGRTPQDDPPFVPSSPTTPWETDQAGSGGMAEAPVTTRPVVGFIGLGDQGLPMATAIAEAGFPLHLWARRPASLDALGGVPHHRHDTVQELAAACDIVCLCVGTDDDVLQLADRLLEGLRPGAVVVNHGTGLPSNAVRQAAIAEIVELAVELKLDAARLVEVLKLGSAASAALSLLNTMVRLDNVEHLSGVEALDMELFDQAMREAGIDAAAATERGLAGARGLTQLLNRLNA